MVTNLVRNKLLFPAKIRKLNSGNLLPYSIIDPIQGVSNISDVSENLLARYRWWWRYLRMCLELEQNGVLLLGSKLRVNRAYYKSWSLEEMLSLSFEKWWVTHEKLFFEEPVRLLSKGEMGRLAKGYSKGRNDDYHFLRVPKTIESSEVLEQVRSQLKHRLRRRPRLFDFAGKSTPLVRHHIFFNCLVLSFNGATREKIMNWCNHQYQGVDGVIQAKLDKQGVAINKVFSHKQSVSRLLGKVRKKLLLISNGYFS